MLRTAVLSADLRYRYRLERTWGEQRPPALFVMLNPSTADAAVDDPTIRRCCGFAKAWGHGGLVVVNLFAFRATDPRDLFTADDPVGPDNDRHLIEAASVAEVVVAAWGAQAPAWRVEQVLPQLGERVVALALTKAGHPRHPLYLPASSQPAPWPAAKTRSRP
ncbi:hypothetical protein CGZ93_08440 [Enemella dayhoffiae]|uniref:DUF1643 domain-containing protein n=1 Tax=Enemella dayhoffiae TaxID=2016507 RepID=A0A255H5X5_9ACTN|nr:DUF1643 domain-containing protein [Enemella dayhoffiae]OYO21954.1 hypothetical protein CGZ93_08440 [Enemella dayhoffiae]